MMLDLHGTESIHGKRRRRKKTAKERVARRSMSWVVCE
jgi:hypothetical protein